MYDLAGSGSRTALGRMDPTWRDRLKHVHQLASALWRFLLSNTSTSLGEGTGVIRVTGFS